MSTFERFTSWFYQLFFGTIESWNNYLLSIQRETLGQSQLVVVRPQDLPETKFHAPTTEFEEDTFGYNLNGRPPHYTGNSAADVWISDFSYLDIDLFTLITQERTLPRLPFVKKRYYRLVRKAHPDKGGTNKAATDINNAYEMISEHLYQQTSEQVNLFQAVFNEAVEQKFKPSEEKSDPTPTSTPSTIPVGVNTPTVQVVDQTSSAPYIILYLVGASAGSILVLGLMRKK